MSGILNLQKNDILDLTKKDPSLNNIMLAAGWDVAKKGFFSFAAHDYDLDLVALLLDENDKLLGRSAIIYFKNQREKGIFLHGDNRTGAGDGDDEMISVTLSEIEHRCKKIVFAITIYDAVKRNQSFEKVKNAYIRLLNEDKGHQEICRFNLSESGENKTALIFAELNKVENDWSFKAVGELMNGSISTLAQRYV